MGGFFKSFIPEKPARRAISLAALAAAGCGGIYYVSRSGVLKGREDFPVKPWQALTLISWAGNSAAIFAGGRLDSRKQGEPKDGELKELPASRFFSPAGWAFAIWAPIISGEKTLAVYQALPLASVRQASGWLAELSPWLGGAYLLQSCWCLSFREWARDAGLLWLPAVFLGGTAACLGGAHGVLRRALASGGMSSLQYGMVHLPISLHYGWVSCAALVNANAHLSLVKGLSEKTRLRFSLASIAAATFLATKVTCYSGDPVYASVVTWALAAIVNGADSKSFQQAAESRNIRAQKRTASVAVLACAATALVGPIFAKML